MDSFYARDVQELFGVRNRSAFMALLKMVTLRNGDMLDISDLAKKSGVSRPTVMAHLDAMAIAHAVIRDNDQGHLWKNLALDEVRTTYHSASIHYWRDKSPREIDFVIEKPGQQVDTIEAKVSPQAFSPDNLDFFRRHCPEGKNYLVCPFVPKPYTIRQRDMGH